MDVKALAADRVIERQPMGVKKHPFQSSAMQLLVERKVTVLVIAKDGKPHMRKVHADLMRAAGLDLCI
jgi:hypothetical protein